MYRAHRRLELSVRRRPAGKIRAFMVDSRRTAGSRTEDLTLEVIVVVGARPNFVKAAPILEGLSRHEGVSTRLVHTGQHYGRVMSGEFFRELELPPPDVNLKAGSGTHAGQTAAVMVGFERVLGERRPDVVVVVGDVNSTMACAVTAAKAEVPVAHVEAGLRSFDRRMPEEVNRIVTDSLSAILFTTEESANRNLHREGHPEERIHFVGNVMIDTLMKLAGKAGALDVAAGIGPGSADYALMTLHRPSNVDESDRLAEIIGAVREICREIQVVFPAHPRAMARLRTSGLEAEIRSTPGFHLVKPLGYLSFLSLMRGARMVLTDSGGVQDETTALGVPCLTLRENTERPVTVELGTSVLVGSSRRRILDAARSVLEGSHKRGKLPPLWDGKAAERIAKVLAEWGGSG